MSQKRSRPNKYKVSNGIVKMELYDRWGNVTDYTLFDEKHLPILSNSRWSRIGCEGHFYVSDRDGLMHRRILKPSDDKYVDHINGNGLDNRDCNIRLATPSDNVKNKGPRKNTSSQYLGVGYQKDKNVWVAYLGIDNKTVFYQRFKSEMEAARARDLAALRYHREFAYLNFEESKAYEGTVLDDFEWNLLFPPKCRTKRLVNLYRRIGEWHPVFSGTNARSAYQTFRRFMNKTYEIPIGIWGFKQIDNQVYAKCISI